MKVNFKKLVFIQLISFITVMLLLTVVASINKIYASEPNIQAPVIVFNRITDIKTDSLNGRCFQAQIGIIGDIKVTGFDINISYDSRKIELGKKNNISQITGLKKSVTNESIMVMVEAADRASYLDLDNSSFRLVFAQPEPENPKNYGDFLGLGYTQGYMPVCTIIFKVLDPEMTEEDITEELFSITPNKIRETGFEIFYTDEPGINAVDYSSANLENFNFGNFANPEEEFPIVEITTLPTKLEYEHGEVIDRSGGEITITYPDGTIEKASMEVDEYVWAQTTNARYSDPVVRLRYKTYDLEYPITVTNPVSNITLEKLPTKLEYDNGDNIDLTGAVVKAETKDGKTMKLALPDVQVLPSSEVADLTKGDITGTNENGLPCGNQTITLDYEGKQTEFNINITDPNNNLEWWWWYYGLDLQVEVNGKNAYKDSDNNYVIEVDENLSQVPVKVTASSLLTWVQIGNNQPNLYQSTKQVQLTGDTTVVPIVATSLNIFSRNAELKIVRRVASDNTSIQSLKVDNMEIPSEDGKTYSVDVGITKSTINLSVLLEDSLAKVKVLGTESIHQLNKTITLNSSGKTTVEIVATSQAGTVKTYTLNIVQIGNISGKVITSNINGIHSANIKVYSSSDTEHVNAIKEITTNSDGTYELSLEKGGYDIVVSKAGYLSHTIKGVLLGSADVELNDIELIPGDINGNGTIGLEDISMIGVKIDAVVGTERYEEKYDLNGDGVIDIVDKEIIRENHGGISILDTWQ